MRTLRKKQRTEDSKSTSAAALDAISRFSSTITLLLLLRDVCDLLPGQGGVQCKSTSNDPTSKAIAIIYTSLLSITYFFVARTILQHKNYNTPLPLSPTATGQPLLPVGSELPNPSTSPSRWRLPQLPRTKASLYTLAECSDLAGGPAVAMTLFSNAGIGLFGELSSTQRLIRLALTLTAIIPSYIMRKGLYDFSLSHMQDDNASTSRNKENEGYAYALLIFIRSTASSSLLLLKTTNDICRFTPYSTNDCNDITNNAALKWTIIATTAIISFSDALIHKNTIAPGKPISPLLKTLSAALCTVSCSLDRISAPAEAITLLAAANILPTGDQAQRAIRLPSVVIATLACWWNQSRQMAFAKYHAGKDTHEHTHKHKPCCHHHHCHH